MKNYLITKTVAGLGYVVGIGIIVLAAIGGVVTAGFTGLIMGAIGGVVMAVPLLLMCEMAIAVVAMEENTRSKN